MRADKRALWLGKRRVAAAVSPYANAETGTLIGRMSVAPSGGDATAIDTFISRGKSFGWWTKMDRVHWLSAHDRQAGRLCWKQSAKACSEVGSLGFTAKRGFNLAAQATGNYLDVTDALVGAAGNNAGLNDSHISVYIQTWAITAGYEGVFEFAPGGASGLTPNGGLGNSGTNPRFFFSMNDGTATGDTTEGSPTIASRKGFWCVNRRAGPIRQLWHENVKNNEDATATTGTSTQSVKLLHGSHNGLFDPPDVGSFLGFQTQGTGLTDLDVADLRAAEIAFLTSVSAT